MTIGRLRVRRLTPVSRGVEEMEEEEMEEEEMEESSSFRRIYLLSVFIEVEKGGHQ